MSLNEFDSALSLEFGLESDFSFVLRYESDDALLCVFLVCQVG